MKLEQVQQNRKIDRDGFTLVEVLISFVIFMIAFAALYTVSSRAMLMLDSSRQTARATDITLANIEYIRTRAWDQLIYYSNTVSGQSISVSSNMISSQEDPTRVCSYIELHPSDPMNIFLTSETGKRPSRELIMQFYPSGEPVTAGGAVTNSVIKVTVVTAWQNMSGRNMTNTMTTLVTKGGLSAHYMGLKSNDVNFLNQLTAH